MEIDNKSYYLRIALLASALIVLLVSRFLFLGEKPYHHDESLYAVEAWKYATKGTYKFSPMFHGPVLFHLHALLFKVFPINDLTGRLPIALIGLSLPILAYCLLRPLGFFPAFLAVLGLVLSSVVIYFSRFLGMDILMASLGLAFLLCLRQVVFSSSRQGFLLATIFLALMVCTKLNFLFYLFAFATFPWVWFYFAEGNLKQGGIRTWAEIRKRLPSIRWLGLQALLLFLVIYCLLYSSFGTNLRGIFDSVGKMIPYWIHQHKIQRIAGPFHYYLPILLVYELPLILGAVGLVLNFGARSMVMRKRLLAWLSWALLGTGVAALTWSGIGSFLEDLLHLNDPVHLLIFLLTIGVWFSVIPFHVARKEPWPTLFAHWSVVSFLLYSYAGEKVPWLTVHLVVPAWLYLASVFPSLLRWEDRRFATRALWIGVAVLCISGQAWLAYQIGFTRSADPRERLVFTHTSYEMKQLAQDIDRFSEKGEQHTVQATGKASWPLAWYFRDYRRWFWPELEFDKNPAILIDDWENKTNLDRTLRVAPPYYQSERVRLREWWEPDSKKATIRRLLAYFFHRKPFSPLGSQDIVIFVRNDLWPQWQKIRND